MKRLILLSTLLFILLTAVGQATDDYKKNFAGIEAGLSHRGLPGLSYSRKIRMSNNFYFAPEMSTGLGLGWGENINFYFAAGPSFQLDTKQFTFTIGADVKYCNMTLFSGIFEKPTLYKGTTVSPIMGIYHVWENGFFLKFKVAATPLIMAEAIERTQLGAGICLGVAF